MEQEALFYFAYFEAWNSTTFPLFKLSFNLEENEGLS